MRCLLVVGGGLFGAQAAAYARSKGIDTLVFDAGLEGAASPAAAGLFKEEWAGQKLAHHFKQALPLLDQLYGIRHVDLRHDDGICESFLFVPPTAILDPAPLRMHVSSIGDGWLEAEGERYEGFVYIAAGVWCSALVPGLEVYGKAGTAFAFAGEREGKIRPIERGRQAIAFVRDPGLTHFGDGTAERDFKSAHEQGTLRLAAEMGLMEPVRRWHGIRPYTPGGPVFRRLGERTWLATGGRKMGAILGAAFARRLIDEELRGRGSRFC